MLQLQGSLLCFIKDLFHLLANLAQPLVLIVAICCKLNSLNTTQLFAFW